MNSKDFHHLIKFYHDCYELDHKALSINNVFGSKIEHRYFLEGEDVLLSGYYNRLPLPDKIANKINDTLENYQTEKELYLMSMLVTHKDSSTCSPLFIYPAKIINGENGFFLEINHDDVLINQYLLNPLKNESSTETPTLFLPITSKGKFSFDEASQTKKILNDHFAEIDANELLMFPQLKQEEYIKTFSPPSKDLHYAHSSAVLGVMKKSSSTLGILSELKSIYNNNLTSNALKSFIGKGANYQFTGYDHHYIPSVLSTSQKKLVSAIYNHDAVLQIGPPGTGKSYTIASIAIDLINKNKSVLIVSKTNHAVDAIEDKLKKDLAIQVGYIRGGRQNYMSELKSRIQDLLSNFPNEYETEVKNSKKLQISIEQKIKDQRKQKKKIDQHLKKELSYGITIVNTQNKESILNKIKLNYLNWRNSISTPITQEIEDYLKSKETLIEELVAYSKSNYQANIYKEFSTKRDTLGLFLKAIRARTLKKQNELFSQIKFESLFKAFPIWLCKTSDLFEVLPLRKELFDVVIIDEASQCDLASTLPALFRAKKVIVSGDPKQLRHFSFLSQDQTSTLAKKNKVEDQTKYTDYVNQSLLDLYFENITNTDQVSFLNEHFRCTPSLIGFNNKAFYNNKLLLMKDLPKHQYKANKIIAVEGKRYKTGYNKKEFEAIYQKIIEHYEHHKGETQIPSVGIVCFLTKQYDYINKQLTKQLDIDIWNALNIKVGTPYQFQGQERDHIFVSWVIDNDTHASAKRYIETPNVFNVATSRAKSYMTHFISFDIQKLENTSIIKRYFHFISNTENENKSIPPKDKFLDLVCEWLQTQNISFNTNIETAGITLNIFIENDNKYYAIDLIGYTGPYQAPLDINQYNILSRAGVKIFPFAYADWTFRQKELKKEFLPFIKNQSSFAL